VTKTGKKEGFFSPLPRQQGRAAEFSGQLLSCKAKNNQKEKKVPEGKVSGARTQTKKGPKKTLQGKVPEKGRKKKRKNRSSSD